jgi:hypothetical protein
MIHEGMQHFYIQVIHTLFLKSIYNILIFTTHLIR